MNIYSITAYGLYCGGMAVVAAKDEKSAGKIVSKHKEDSGSRGFFPIDYSDSEAEITLLGNDPSIKRSKFLNIFEYGE